MSKQYWQGKSFLVLGATSGLAEQTLLKLAEGGAGLCLQGRDELLLSKRAEALKQLGAAVTTVTADVTEDSLGDRLWENLSQMDEKPFGFLCFIGIPGRMKVEDWTPSTLSSVFSVNCAGPLLACRSWIYSMKSAGHSGNAVLFSTMQAQYPFEGSLVYSLGKVALEHGVKILAKEAGPKIAVNAIAPGVHESGMAVASIQKGKYKPYIEQEVIERYGQPEDVEKTVNYLLQPSLYMTGQTLLLDGGLTLRKDQMS